EEIGLQVPISVYERRFTPPPTELVPNPEPDSGWEYVLIAGHHRLEAFKRLGAEEEGRDDLRHWHRRFVFIPVCIFQNLDHARIWEVHENTARGSLSKEERDRQLRVLADRKRAAAEAAGVSMQCIKPPTGRKDIKTGKPPGRPKKAWTQHSCHQTQSSSQTTRIACPQRLPGVLIRPQPVGLCLEDTAPGGVVLDSREAPACPS